MTTEPILQLIHNLRSETSSRHADMTDPQLLEAFCRNRDEAAFATLVRQHGPMVFGVCRRMLGNLTDAEDAFQATFLVLVRKAASIRRRTLLANWLYGVACRTAMKSRTTTAKRKAKEQQAARPEAIEAEVGSDLLAVLDEELERLPERYRKAIVLCDLEGKTRKEAARQLTWPEGTVATCLTRGRALLAGRLAKRGVTLSGTALAAVLAPEAASASVPAALLSSTTQAACSLISGQTVGTISPQVAHLFQGVLKTMLVSKLKTIAFGLLLLFVVIAVSGLLWQGLSAQQNGKEPAGQQKAQQPAIAPADKKIWQAKGELKLEGPITAIEASPDGKMLAIASDFAADAPAHSIFIWDVTLTRKLQTIAAIGPVAFSPDSKRLAVNSTTGTVRVVDIVSGKILAELKGNAKDASLMVLSLTFSPDGKHLAVGRGNPDQPADLGLATVWELSSNQKRHTFPLPEGGIYAVAFSPEGNDLYTFTSGQETSLKIWDLKTGQTRATVKGPGGRFLPIAISKDRKLVATGIDPIGDTGAMDIKIWELATGKERLTVNRGGHKQVVQALAFSPDGHLLASAASRLKGENREGELRLWDVANGKQLALLHGHKDEIRAVAFTPDGKALFTSSWDGRVIRWELGADKKQAGVKDGAKSKDGKLALHLAAREAKVKPDQPLELIATLKNLSNQPIHVIRPFGDWYEARAIGLDIRGPAGKLKYLGPTPGYVIGSTAFTTLKSGQSVQDSLKLTSDEFDLFQSPGKYTIAFDYAYDGHWDYVAKRADLPTDNWQGKIRSNTITVEILKGKIEPPAKPLDNATINAGLDPKSPRIQAFVAYLKKNGMTLVYSDSSKSWHIVQPRPSSGNFSVSIRSFPDWATEQQMGHAISQINLAYKLNAPAHLAVSYFGGIDAKDVPKAEFDAVEKKLNELFQKYQPGGEK